MRVHLALKLLSLVVVGVTSVVVTLTVMASLRGVTASPPAPPVLPPTTIVTRSVPEGAEIPRGPGGVPVTPNAIYGVDYQLVGVDGSKAHLRVKASIQDNRPGMNYVWAVQVFEIKNGSKRYHVINEGKPLYRKVYDEQVFGVPQGERIEVTFEDVVDLPVPKGRYEVRLAAYKIFPGQGLATMRFNRSSQGPAVPFRFVVGN